MIPIYNPDGGLTVLFLLWCLLPLQLQMFILCRTTARSISGLRTLFLIVCFRNCSEQVVSMLPETVEVIFGLKMFICLIKEKSLCHGTMH